ncbi:MAG: hypothetical protein E6K62_05415 [Nitrospirae bacterium]|nr:MAG: hypothetical protein E6K62_05415 [Nitrospirota bacterium]
MNAVRRLAPAPWSGSNGERSPFSSSAFRQAIDAIVKANRKGDRTSVVGDWTVRNDERNGYLVRVVVRLPGDEMRRWVEWEYLWRVRLSPPTVIPLSRPAVEIMP